MKTPIDVPGLTSGVSAVSAGEADTCVAMSAGGVKCWGTNTYGQLGDNSTTDSLAPVNVVGISSTVSVLSVSYYNHVCAVLTNGGVKCWGYNYVGKLGNNSTVNSSVSVDVQGL